MEDYLKAIYQAASDEDKVSTSSLAQQMNCSPASVTNMLQKLSELKLVEYEPYQGVTLTPSGSKVALEILRHHRLIELYLADVLGYSWDKIDQALGHPTIDPHGDPIPTKEGTIAMPPSQSLWETPGGKKVQVYRVSDRDPEVLRYLATIGILPEVEINVLKKGPFNGPIHVQIEDSEHSLSEELATQIFVVSK